MATQEPLRQHAEQPSLASAEIPRAAVTGYETFTIVPVVATGEPHGGPRGSAGLYRVVFVLGVPGISSVSAALDLFALEHSGDSLIISAGREIALEAPQEESSWRFLPNEDGRLGRAEITLHASDFQNAVTEAHNQVLTLLSRIAFELNTGVEVTAIITTEKATGTVSVSATMLGRARPLQNIAGQMTPELAQLLSTYREGLSSTTPLYQALSFYRVCEGISTFHTRAVRTAEREGEAQPIDPLGDTFPSAGEVSEIDAIDPAEYPECDGKTLREVWEAHSDAIRNAVSHMTPGRDLIVADRLDDLSACRKAIAPLRCVAHRALNIEITRTDG